MSKNNAVAVAIGTMALETIAGSIIEVATKNMNKDLATIIKIGVAILIPIGIAALLSE
jgi:hypothetical protein